MSVQQQLGPALNQVQAKLRQHFEIIQHQKILVELELSELCRISTVGDDLVPVQMYCWLLFSKEIQIFILMA